MAIAVPAVVGYFGGGLRYSLAWGALLAVYVTVVKPILRRGGLPSHGIAVFLVTCPPGLALFVALAFASHQAAVLLAR